MQATYSTAPRTFPWPPLFTPSCPTTSAPQPAICVPAHPQHIWVFLPRFILFLPGVKVCSQTTCLGCILKESSNQECQEEKLLQPDLTLFEKENHPTLVFGSEGLRENPRFTPSGEAWASRDTTVSRVPQRQR